MISTLNSAIDAALAKEKEVTKKMEANKARALNGMKQKVRKTVREYESQVKAFEADPEAFEAQYQASIAVEAPITRAPRSTAPVDVDDEAGADTADRGFTVVGQSGKQYEFTKDAIYKTLKAVQEARGKKVCQDADTMVRLKLTGILEYRSCRANEDPREAPRGSHHTLQSYSRASGSHICTLRL